MPRVSKTDRLSDFFRASLAGKFKVHAHSMIDYGWIYYVEPVDSTCLGGFNPFAKKFACIDNPSQLVEIYDPSVLALMKELIGKWERQKRRKVTTRLMFRSNQEPSTA